MKPALIVLVCALTACAPKLPPPATASPAPTPEAIEQAARRQAGEEIRACDASPTAVAKADCVNAAEQRFYAATRFPYGDLIYSLAAWNVRLAVAVDKKTLTPAEHEAIMASKRAELSMESRLRLQEDAMLASPSMAPYGAKQSVLRQHYLLPPP